MKKTPESNGDVNREPWCHDKELEAHRRRAKEAMTAQSALTGDQYDAAITVADYTAVLEARIIRLISETGESRSPFQKEPDIRQQLAEEAGRLRRRAKEIRDGTERPDLEKYVQAGRGPQYEPAQEAWLQVELAARSLEDGANQIEAAAGLRKQIGDVIDLDSRRPGPTEASETFEQRIVRLARSFPSLADKPVLDSWNATELDEWATTSPAVTTGSLHAARFVLSVWNPTTEWQCGKFDIHEALGGWDGPHRAAFRAWVASPWWP